MKIVRMKVRKVRWVYGLGFGMLEASSSRNRGSGLCKTRALGMRASAPFPSLHKQLSRQFLAPWTLTHTQQQLFHNALVFAAIADRGPRKSPTKLLSFQTPGD